jgi:hypothetical protein
MIHVWILILIATGNSDFRTMLSVEYTNQASCEQAAAYYNDHHIDAKCWSKN